MTWIIVSPPAPGLLNHAIALSSEIKQSGKSALLVSGPEAISHFSNICYEGPYKLLNTHSLSFKGKERIGHFSKSCTTEYIESAFHELDLIVNLYGATGIISKNQPHSKLVAHYNNIPWVTYHTGGLFHLHKEMSPFLQIIKEDCLKELQKISLNIIGSNIFQEKENIFLSQKMNLVRGVPLLFKNISANEIFNVPFLFTGALTFDGNLEISPKVSRENPIFVTFGTVCNDFNLYQMIFQYIKNLNLSAVMSWPDGKNIDSNFIDIHTYIPNSTIVPISSLVVHHGGVGTLLTCLNFGTPQIILPYNFERTCQLLHGKNLESLGLAKVWERNKDFQTFMSDSIAWSNCLKTKNRIKEFSTQFRVQDAQYRKVMSQFFNGD